MTEEGPADRFVAGFIGIPGQRTFYLEVERGTSRSWFVVEKAQVAAFSSEAARLLEELGFSGAGDHLDLGELSDPDNVVFRVAEMRIAYSEPDGLVSVALRATDDEAAVFSFAVTPAQLDAAARAGVVAVEAGRPLCPHCGLAMDPDGHVCPTTNGDLRSHQP